MATIDIADLDVRTKLAELDRIYAHTHQLVADLSRVRAETDRKRQEIWFAPWQIGLSLATLGAAFFAAGATFIKVLGG